MTKRLLKYYWMQKDLVDTVKIPNPLFQIPINQQDLDQ